MKLSGPDSPNYVGAVHLAAGGDYTVSFVERFGLVLLTHAEGEDADGRAIPLRIAITDTGYEIARAADGMLVMTLTDPPASEQGPPAVRTGRLYWA